MDCDGSWLCSFMHSGTGGEMNLLLQGFSAFMWEMMLDTKCRHLHSNCYENKLWPIVGKPCNAFTDGVRTSAFLLSQETAVSSSWTQVWSQSEGQEGFNPNLLLSLLTAWHTWAVQLHFPLICWAAWMAGWREIDWRGNGLIVLTLTAGMQIALHYWSPLWGEHCVEKPRSYLLWWEVTYKKVVYINR